MMLGSLCGLIVKEKNTPIPLTSVNYDVRIRSFASRINIEQTYKNEEDVDLECVYGFPINDQASIVGFTVTIDERVIQSQFKKKDEAFKDYSEALERGDGAYLLDQADRSDDTFILSVGRLPPKKECLISISYVCTLESVNETILRLVIPTSLYPRYSPASDLSKYYAAPPAFYQSSVSYSCTLNASIDAFDKVKSVTSSTHPLSVYLESDTKVNVTFGAKQQAMDKDFVLDIEVVQNPEQHVEMEEYAPNKFAAMFSYVPHSDELKRQVNSELVFLVDCSGSMHGDKIEDAKTAMQLFLRSIPQGCYFNFYRFGSSFTSLFPESVAYNETSFNQAKAYTTATSADMEGTEILQPLRGIYAKELKPGFSRQLFVLTDGEVTNTEQVINIVRENASNTRVFSFGLGDSPSRSLVNGVAMAGNGKSEFIKHGEDLTDKICRHLSRALQPAVTDAAVSWEGVKEVQQAPTKLPPVFFGDRQLVFALFEKNAASDEPSQVVLQTGSETKRKSFDLSKAVQADGELFISKLAARALIKEIETAPTTSVEPDDKKLTEKITEISLLFGIMSKYVSLLAIEQRENVAPGEMEFREIPVLLAGNNPPMAQIQMLPMQMDNEMSPEFSGWGVAPQFALNKIYNMYHVSALMQPTVARMKRREFGEQLDEIAECTPTASSNRCNGIKRKITASLGFEDSVDAGGISVAVKEKPQDNIPVSGILNSILALQNWDGSWSLGSELANLVPGSRDILAKLGSHVDEKVGITLILILWIQKHYSQQINTWKAIVDKALLFVPPPPPRGGTLQPYRKSTP